MVTIRDVAEKSGVAISTVSNIINDTRSVSPEITKRVLAVIKDLGYEADPIARSMKGGSNRMIGMIITSFQRIFFASLISRCREIASAQGYTLMCMETNDDFELEEQYVRLMKCNRFDAIILNSVAEFDNKQYYEELRTLSYRGKRVPVVCIGRNMMEYDLDSVGLDNYDGAVMATNHLISLGCKRVMHITGPSKAWPTKRRILGYCDTIEQHHLSDKKIVEGDFSTKSGYEAVRNTVVSRNKLPFDGIFASNDQMAVGALKALLDLGVDVPDTVKVVGFDDSFVASLVEPSLTSIHVSGASMGAEALRMALERISDLDLPPRYWPTKTELVVRKSTVKDIYVSTDYSNW